MPGHPEPSFACDRLDLIARLESWHFWFVARRALLERLLGRHAPDQPATFLDIGCGTGWALGGAREQHRTMGLDLRPEGLRRVRAGNSSAWLAQADARRLPIACQVCDGVIALDVLEHTDDGAAVMEIVRVLRRGGIAVITVPALPGLWSARDEAAGHRRRYTRRALLDVLRSNGLDILEVRFYQCLLLPLVMATRLAARRTVGTLAFEERPPAWLNRILAAINRFEVRLGNHVAWPWGSSLAVVCRKP